MRFEGEEAESPIEMRCLCSHVFAHLVHKHSRVIVHGLPLPKRILCLRLRFENLIEDSRVLEKSFVGSVVIMDDIAILIRPSLEATE